MKVFVNEKEVHLEKTTHVQGLLEDLKYAGLQGVAVAINNEVIPHRVWKKTCVKDNDAILIVKATQGG